MRVGRRGPRVVAVGLQKRVLRSAITHRYTVCCMLTWKGPLPSQKGHRCGFTVSTSLCCMKGPMRLPQGMQS